MVKYNEVLRIVLHVNLLPKKMTHDDDVNNILVTDADMPDKLSIRGKIISEMDTVKDMRQYESMSS